MQILLTKKLADVMAVKPALASETIDPIFAWTANWVNTFDRRKEDMIVMVNNATRFTVTIYGVKRNQFKDIATKMTAAIRNTLLSLQVNPEVVDEYLLQAGAVQFGANHDRKLAACVNHQGLDAAFTVGRTVNESAGKIKYEDTLGRLVSDRIVNYSGSHDDGFIPREKILAMLTELTGKPLYQYRAFELLVTLDLDIYKATRRLIVPADLAFSQLHKVLQDAFHWHNHHLYDFAVFDGKSRAPVTRLVTSNEELDYDDQAVLMADHKLSDYLPKNKFILYTYDMGDSWEHQIEFVREIENHDAESPYLLEAVGQTPPEDVGGVGGFVGFREIMLNTSHPEYEETKEWAGYWSPELREWERRPHVLRV